LAEVKRSNKKGERERILRRDDFYDPDEVDRLLQHAPGVLEEAFWLLGAHAGFRLPGEAQGLTRGAVDFPAGVIGVHDNWVRNARDTTKTSDSEAIPMTPRLTRALATLMDRSSATGNEDLVFASELRDGPVSERLIRAAFKLAQQKAGLKPIKMYNLRHSFGTTLARNRVDVRTIQALMPRAHPPRRGRTCLSSGSSWPGWPSEPRLRRCASSSTRSRVCRLSGRASRSQSAWRTRSTTRCAACCAALWAWMSTWG
jgi:integrase